MIQKIYEDSYCFIVTKPNNVLVHHAHHSRNKLDEFSLVQLIKNQFREKYYPVHRLDRKTSGLVLFAKDTSYVSKFQELFIHQKINKTYFAIVRGFSKDALHIDSPVKGRDANEHKDAETVLKTLCKIELDIPVKPYDSSRYSMVSLTPKTGRLHQLRIHMNKIANPIIGDPKYGDKNHNLMFQKQFGCSHLFLHAGSLSFFHPFTEEKIDVNSDFPEDWLKIFEHFDWKNPLK